MLGWVQRVSLSVTAAIVGGAIIKIFHIFDFYPERLLAYWLLPALASNAMNEALGYTAMIIVAVACAVLVNIAVAKLKRDQKLDALGAYITGGVDLIAKQPSTAVEWAAWQAEFNSWRDGWKTWVQKNYSEHDAHDISSIGSFYETAFANSYNDLHNRMQNIVQIYVERLKNFLREKKKQ